MSGMMKNKGTYSTTKNKYLGGFIVLSLTIALLFCLGIRVYEPNGSIQMSSEMTPSASEQYYNLQVELMTSQPTIIDRANGIKESVVIPAGSIVSMSIPRSAMGNINLNQPNNINLEKVVETYNNQSGLKAQPPYQVPFNDVDIDKTKNTQLVGQSIRLPMQILARGNLKIKRISEDIDDDDDGEDDVATEGKPPCLTCGLNSMKNKGLDIITWSKKLFRSTVATSMDGAVSSYEKSSEVRRLMVALKKGYTARNNKTHKTSFPKANVVSRSIKACYNGVKAALVSGGMVDELLNGNLAKDAGPELTSHGFLNLLKTEYRKKINSPYDAPVGSVLVYAPTDRTRAGHIEIRTENGFQSDYYSTNARTGPPSAGFSGKKRVLIGVYIKKTPEINGYLAYQGKGSKNEQAD
jgi:hypothetical protein